MSSVVFSVRIDRKSKELLDQFREVVWSEEVRRFLRKRVMVLAQERILREADEVLEQLRKELGLLSSSAELIRRDREAR